MRKEEIKQAAQAYYPKGTLHEEKAVSSFIRGAKWADKTMIEKACQWLIRRGYFVNSNETIEDFRKAMEE